jgi:hypothetical protein
MDPIIAASAYLQAGGGMGETNRTVLSTLARWQDEAQLPLLVGGDFNLNPAKILESDFAVRSGTQIFAPSCSTYRTTKARTTIDYFLVSSSLSNKLQRCQVIEGFPLKPHLPVQLRLRIGCIEWVPVLEMPTKLPTEIPFGPRLEPMDWREIDELVEQGHRYMTDYSGTQWEGVQVLDQIYAAFVVAFETQICQLTDVPRRRNSGRGRPPKIRWIDGSRRAARQFKSWHTLDRPLMWLTQWTQCVLRYITEIGEETTAAF